MEEIKLFSPQIYNCSNALKRLNTILKCFQDFVSSYLHLLAGGRTLRFLQLYSRSNQVLTEGMQLLGCVRDQVSVFSNYTMGLFLGTHFNPPSFLHNPETDSHAMKVVLSPTQTHSAI